MNVSLSSKWDEWIQGKVKTGLYQSASEVIREALRLLREREQLRELHRQELRRQIGIGTEQLDCGSSYPVDEKLIKKVKRRGRRKLGE